MLNPADDAPLGTTVAIIDLGSTSFHALVCEVDADGFVLPLARDRDTLHLGGAVGRTGGIDPDHLAQAVQSIGRLHHLASQLPTTHLRVVATSAIRDASNSAEVLDALEQRISHPIQVLSGADEARYAFFGQLGAVTGGRGPRLAMDIGGGSLELAVGTPQLGPSHVLSLPLGASRMASRFVAHDPGTPAEFDALRAEVARICETIPEAFRSSDHIVCSGGTTRAIARYYAADRWGDVPASVNQTVISRKSLAKLDARWQGTTRKQRLRLPGVEERRVDVLAVGVAVLNELCASLDIKTLIVSDHGMREGLALEAAGLISADGAPSPALADPRATGVEHLHRQFPTDRAHGDHVARLAMEIFSGVAKPLGIKRSWRHVLWAGAQLHDIGTALHLSGHHRHGAYLVENALLPGFSPSDIAAIASIVRFHKGSGPKTSFPAWTRVEQQRIVEQLIGIVRVADALDRNRTQKVELSRVTVSHARITLHVHPGELDTEVLADLDLKTDVLARACDREVVVKILEPGALH
ncbi:MAG: Ppx/GppA family phosphatase [Actinobacteria bacterium]|nr:Ppx/GppA family phosphatase [Actinomycetota bacterium]MCB9389013.1 Ppx/GppA family phosphatase [Acidimicrobiia bacterium]